MPPHPSRQVFANRINAWFRSRVLPPDVFGNEDPTPLETVAAVSSLFLDKCDAFEFDLNVPEPTFRKYMCDALCALYVAQQYDKRVISTRKIEGAPRGWSTAAENAWNDYIYTRYFTDRFWEIFWERVGDAGWEVDVPRWREFFQGALLMYLKRDSARLLEEGLVVNGPGGVLVSPDEKEDNESEDDE